jgi:hypothetical protein
MFLVTEYCRAAMDKECMRRTEYSLDMSWTAEEQVVPTNKQYTMKRPYLTEYNTVRSKQ